MNIFSAIQTYAVMGVGIVVGLGTFYLYNILIDNPRILADARKGYALESTVVALESQLQKERYYRSLANEARDKATEDLLELTAKQKERDSNAQTHISKDATSVRPSATQSDLDWLRNSYGPKTSSGSSGEPKGASKSP